MLGVGVRIGLYALINCSPLVLMMYGVPSIFARANVRIRIKRSTLDSTYAAALSFQSRRQAIVVEAEPHMSESTYQHSMINFRRDTRPSSLLFDLSANVSQRALRQLAPAHHTLAKSLES